MRISVKYLYGLLFLFLTAAGAQAGEVTLHSSVDRNSIFIGDEIRYTVRATSPENLKVFLPDLGGNLGGFEIKNYDTHETHDKKEKGRVIREFIFTISTYDTGDFMIPSFRLFYADRNGRTNMLKTDEIKITVKPMLSSSATNEDIHDVKPQLFMKDKLLWLKLLIVFLVAAAAAGFWIFRKKLLKREPIFLPLVKKGLPADVEALERLKKILESDLLRKKEIKQYYSLINETIRQYLARRFEILTLERTSEEILIELRSVFMEKELFGIIVSFFEDSDLVKFAKLIPTSNQIKGFTDTAYTIIERTKLQPQLSTDPEKSTDTQQGSAPSKDKHA
jgi:hypothetical protein